MGSRILSTGCLAPPKALVSTCTICTTHTTVNMWREESLIKRASPLNPPSNVVTKGQGEGRGHVLTIAGMEGGICRHGGSNVTTKGEGEGEGQGRGDVTTKGEGEGRRHVHTFARANTKPRVHSTQH